MTLDPREGRPGSEVKDKDMPYLDVTVGDIGPPGKSGSAFSDEHRRVWHYSNHANVLTQNALERKTEKQSRNKTKGASVTHSHPKRYEEEPKYGVKRVPPGWLKFRLQPPPR